MGSPSPSFLFVYSRKISSSSTKTIKPILLSAFIPVLPMSEAHDVVLPETQQNLAKRNYHSQRHFSRGAEHTKEHIGLIPTLISSLRAYYGSRSRSGEENSRQLTSSSEQKPRILGRFPACSLTTAPLRGNKWGKLLPVLQPLTELGRPLLGRRFEKASWNWSTLAKVFANGDFVLGRRH